MNINTALGLLSNCRKMFPWVFYIFCNGWWKMGTNAKTSLCRL